MRSLGSGRLAGRSARPSSNSPAVVDFTSVIRAATNSASGRSDRIRRRMRRPVSPRRHGTHRVRGRFVVVVAGESTGTSIKVDNGVGRVVWSTRNGGEYVEACASASGEHGCGEARNGSNGDSLLAPQPIFRWFHSFPPV